jgi:hypothetical protein
MYVVGSDVMKKARCEIRRKRATRKGIRPADSSVACKVTFSVCVFLKNSHMHTRSRIRLSQWRDFTLRVDVIKVV